MGATRWVRQTHHWWLSDSSSVEGERKLRTASQTRSSPTSVGVDAVRGSRRLDARIGAAHRRCCTGLAASAARQQTVLRLRVIASLLSNRSDASATVPREQHSAGASWQPQAPETLRGARDQGAPSGTPRLRTSAGSLVVVGAGSASCGSSGTSHRGRSGRLASSEASGRDFGRLRLRPGPSGNDVPTGPGFGPVRPGATSRWLAGSSRVHRDSRLQGARPLRMPFA